MAIFKRKRTKNGKIIQDTGYTIQFTDHNCIRRRLPAFESKRLSEAMLAKVEALVSCRVAGIQPDNELQRWVEMLASGALKKLKSFDLIEEKRLAGSRLLSELLSDYKDVMSAQGKSKVHIEKTFNRVSRIIDECKFRYIRDVTMVDVSRFLKGITSATPTTKNHYLTAMRMFLNYLVNTGQITKNPISTLSKLQEDREKRGVLTGDQFIKLIKHTQMCGRIICNSTGKDRAMLYLLAGNTGLRRSELLSLTWKDMKIDGDKPVVIVDGTRTKNRKEAAQPIPQDVADAFNSWKLSKCANDTNRVFDSVGESFKTAQAIKTDLEAAGLPATDRAGNEIDFHSLRNTYISFLANSNTPAKVIQQLARHSSIDLTMNIYARASAYNEQKAIENLPKLTDDTSAEKQVNSKTGTDDLLCGEIRDTPRDTKPAHNSEFSRTSADSNEANLTVVSKAKNLAFDVKNEVFGAISQGGTRTHTTFRSRDFKSPASAIPPLGRK